MSQGLSQVAASLLSASLLLDFLIYNGLRLHLNLYLFSLFRPWLALFLTQNTTFLSAHLFQPPNIVQFPDHLRPVLGGLQVEEVRQDVGLVHVYVVGDHGWCGVRGTVGGGVLRQSGCD